MCKNASEERNCKKTAFSARRTLEAELKKIEGEGNEFEKAKLARVLRLETMEGIRKQCDEAEGLVPAGMWSLATYKDLLFLDSHQASTIAGGEGK